MPEVDTVAPPVTGAEPAPAARPPKEGATKRKLGLGGWIAASWLILLVIVAVVAPLLVASPTTEGQRSLRACGDGTGLPVYEPLNCRDREAVRNQRKDGDAVGKIDHLTGVDSAGRDVFSRVLLGTRATLIIAVTSIVAATILGGALGLIAGYFRGRIDTVISTLFDVMIAFPPLILGAAVFKLRHLIGQPPVFRLEE